MEILFHSAVLAAWLLEPRTLAALIRWFKHCRAPRYWYRCGDYFVLGDDEDDDTRRTPPAADRRFLTRR